MITYAEYVECIFHMMTLYHENGLLDVPEDELRKDCDRMLQGWVELEWTLPDRPGAYLDSDGYCWQVDIEGCWIDQAGIRHEPWHRFFLVLRGPWTDIVT